MSAELRGRNARDDLATHEGDVRLARRALWLSRDEMEVVALALDRACERGLMGHREGTAREVEQQALDALHG